MFCEKKSLSFVIIIVAVLAGTAFLNFLHKQDGTIKIGYFHGGRTTLFYRAHINDYFEREDIEISLITKTLHDDFFQIVSKIPEKIPETERYGKITGEELVGEIVNGNLDGATVGESSFIKAVSKGLPIVAVAELGHDLKEHPGHAIIFRNDVVINTPEDIKGKVLVTRRSGPGDKVFLREFLRDEGLNPGEDVIILDNLSEEKVEFGLQDKSIDGGYYHLNTIKRLVDSDIAYIYRTLDWMNPELSHALLVFRKDFVEKHPEKIRKILKAYMQRIKYEHNLSSEQRKKHTRKGLQMELDFMGMNIPQYDFPPLVSSDLLSEMQEFLYRYGFIDQKTGLENFIDNSFVESIMAEYSSIN